MICFTVPLINYLISMEYVWRGSRVSVLVENALLKRMRDSQASTTSI
jgi:hypothetical protein